MPRNPAFQSGPQVGQVVNSMDNVMLSIAQQRYRQKVFQQNLALNARRMQLEAELNRKKGSLIDAQALFQSQRAKELERENQAFTDMGDAGERFIASRNWAGPLAPGQENPMMGDAIQDMTGAMLRLPSNKTSYAPEKIAQMSMMSDELQRQMIGVGGDVNNLFAKINEDQIGVPVTMPGMEAIRGTSKLNPGETLYGPSRGDATPQAVATGPGKPKTTQDSQRWNLAMRFINSRKDMMGNLNIPDAKTEPEAHANFQAAMKIITDALSTPQGEIDGENEGFSVHDVSSIIDKSNKNKSPAHFAPNDVTEDSMDPGDANGEEDGEESGVPDIEASRQEAQALIKKHPDKANAIKKRFMDVYKQQL